MSGARLCAVLGDLGFSNDGGGGGDHLDPDSFEWPFQYEEVRPVLDWICSTLRPSNVLSASELSQYNLSPLYNLWFVLLGLGSCCLFVQFLFWGTGGWESVLNYGKGMKFVLFTINLYEFSFWEERNASIVIRLFHWRMRDLRASELRKNVQFLVFIK